MKNIYERRNNRIMNRAGYLLLGFTLGTTSYFAYETTRVNDSENENSSQTPACLKKVLLGSTLLMGFGVSSGMIVLSRASIVRTPSERKTKESELELIEK